MCRRKATNGTRERREERPVVVALACTVGRGKSCLDIGSFGEFETWQMVALNAHKKPLLQPGGALQLLLWPCGGLCVREWRVLGLLGYLVPAELGGLLEGLERLRPGKRQP